ncbi:RNA pol II accessory factor, Cdc73 family-domain-containing protein [Cantharellus anzutake]|uniref:RNA pol II accessory factor, Cdc73 family-domain-containing protein n=1 Tax=Cantharellus anzutake TaxID=1750568 RepID=UPI0019049BD2|nr:RNA pol II accessory factor, Cdc73 family-domain-containing protein [Cantharellus anzutake]KAF8344129.1 RNA pol II accessory factor, Cdc73 family-domain-containing protein [Cantharellus anzutake]
MDVLIVLRQAIKAKQPIVYLDASSQSCQTLQQATYISLGPGTNIPKTAATRFQKPNASTRDWVGHPEDFFTLQAVIVAWMTKDAPTTEYLKQARENLAGAGFVSVTDRKLLVEWLEGKSVELERLIPIESTTPEGSPRATTSALPGTGTSISRPTGAAAEKRPYTIDQKDVLAVKRIRANEVELRDRNTVLRGVKNHDFSSVKTLIADRIKAAKEQSKPPAPTTDITAGNKTDPNASAKKNRNVAPIIMIPSSPTSLITMYNVRKFLEDALYESPEDAKRRMAAEGNSRLDDVLPIYRKKNLIVAGRPEGGVEKPIKYFVVDGVEALGKFGTDAWDRVVCVMTTGQAWQFKPYKWSDPTQLFHHVKGIHVTWANDPPNSRIRDWNVSDLKIDSNRRHLDKSTVANFWMQIDDWIQANKPWLPT